MVLGAQPRVPIHFGIVEPEDAILFFDLDVHVVRAGEHLVPEGTELVLLADVVCFVDDGADGWVFVHEHGGDEVFVGEVLVAEVEMGCFFFGIGI